MARARLEWVRVPEADRDCSLPLSPAAALMLMATGYVTVRARASALWMLTATAYATIWVRVRALWTLTATVYAITVPAAETAGGAAAGSNTNGG